MRNRVTSVSLLCVVLLFLGCTRSAVPMPPLEEPTSAAVASADMPNPASAYCEEQGGTLDIRTDVEGGQFGVCIFADGSECDEWAYFRGECAPAAEASTGAAEAAPGMPNPASVYCEAQGGVSEIRTGEGGGQVGICVFPDGSECDEWDLFHGDCAPGVVGYLPDAAELQSFEYVDWQSYKHAVYGLSLRFPPDWRVAEVTDPADTLAGHRVSFTLPDDPLVTLHVAFKTMDEDQQIAPSGIGAGDLVDRGSVFFLGEELGRQALVAEGITMGVLYGGTGEIMRGEHTFWIALQVAGSPSTDRGLSPEVQRLADLIITSLHVEP